MRDNFNKWKKPEILEGKLTKWNWMVQGVEGLVLGEYTDIGAFTYINASYGVEINDYVQIGGGVKIYSLDTIDDIHGKVILQKNCKIGANSVILPDVTIGENSIVGACSVVRYGTIIPSNEIWLGCPAKYYKDVKHI